MAATHSHVGMNSNRTRPTEDIFNSQDPQIREVGLGAIFLKPQELTSNPHEQQT